MMTNYSMSESDTRIHNLRKELARQIWLMRNNKINMFEMLENINDLVTLCPEELMNPANELQHKIRVQMTVKYGKKRLIDQGRDASELHVPIIRTRDYLKAVRLPKNMIG